MFFFNKASPAPSPTGPKLVWPKAGVVLALLMLIICAFGRPAMAGTTIDTTSSWDGSQAAEFWGLPDTATYGQTFTAPADNVLDNFTFYIKNSSVHSIVYEPDVYAWDGSKATGPALFSGATGTVTPGNNFVAYTTNTGGVTLTAGSQYVAFFTTSGHQSGQPDASIPWGFTSVNPYSGGQFVYLNNTNDHSALTTSPWNTSLPGDLAFKANFSSPSNPTPEPSSTATMGLGLFGVLGLGFFARKRRQGLMPA